MLRSCVKFASNTMKLTVKDATLNFPQDVSVIKRWAGHSKWQNIKHVKSANDQLRMRTNEKYCRMIVAAIREGKSSNPDANTKLQNIISRARKDNMPVATIQNAIKQATQSKATETSDILVCRGPGRCALLIEVISSQPVRTQQLVVSVLKKHSARYDPSAINDYEHKGIIICEPAHQDKLTLDNALDHAIVVEAEDVHYIEDKTKLKFVCSPEKVLKVKKELEKLGYSIDLAVDEYIPTRMITLSDEDVEKCNKLVGKLEDFPEVVRVIDNIS